jgi:hypothetical protein
MKVKCICKENFLLSEEGIVESWKKEKMQE